MHRLIRDLLFAELRYERPGTAAALKWMCTAWRADTDQLAGAAPRPGPAARR